MTESLNKGNLSKMKYKVPEITIDVDSDKNSSDEITSEESEEDDSTSDDNDTDSEISDDSDTSKCSSTSPTFGEINEVNEGKKLNNQINMSDLMSNLLLNSGLKQQYFSSSTADLINKLTPSSLLLLNHLQSSKTSNQSVVSQKSQQISSVGKSTSSHNDPQNIKLSLTSKPFVPLKNNSRENEKKGGIFSFQGKKKYISSSPSDNFNINLGETSAISSPGVLNVDNSLNFDL
jgi:hypothetical protein